MTCADFDQKLDRYLDHRLSSGENSSVRDHLKLCTSCRALATAQQECQALLLTAVTDVVTAVDVSAIWTGVSAAIDAEPTRKHGWFQDQIRGLRTWWDGIRETVSFGHTAWAGAAAAAVLVTMFTIGGGETGSDRVAGSSSTETAAIERIASTPSRLASRSTSPSLQRSRSGTRVASVGVSSNTRRRSSVRLDKLETSTGHTVATWTQPKTNSRVIWVASDEVGAMGPMH